MVKNLTGGTGSKKQQSGARNYKSVDVGEEYSGKYGIVKCALGQLAFQVDLDNTKTTNCNVRGAMRKKAWIRIGNIIVVSKDGLDIERIVRESDPDYQTASKILRETYGKNDLFVSVEKEKPNELMIASNKVNYASNSIVAYDPLEGMDIESPDPTQQKNDKAAKKENKQQLNNAKKSAIGTQHFQTTLPSSAKCEIPVPEEDVDMDDL